MLTSYRLTNIIGAENPPIPVRAPVETDKMGRKNIPGMLCTKGRNQFPLQPENRLGRQRRAMPNHRPLLASHPLLFNEEKTLKKTNTGLGLRCQARHSAPAAIAEQATSPRGKYRAEKAGGSVGGSSPGCLQSSMGDADRTIFGPPEKEGPRQKRTFQSQRIRIIRLQLFFPLHLNDTQDATFRGLYDAAPRFGPAVGAKGN